MKHKSIYKKIIAFVVLCSTSGSLIPAAFAEVAVGKHTFKITAYYSPLPNQAKYLRGSYEADIRLNGKGEYGASGVKVFPGMLAAPRTFPFGTKIKIGSFGVGTVADRGGAIVNAGENSQSYDRIDMWMGFGDTGLTRALTWGSRVIDGEVLADAQAQNTLDYSNLRSELGMGGPDATISPINTLTPEQIDAQTKKDELFNSFPVNLGRGKQGYDVKLIQASLKKLGYFKEEIDGNYNKFTAEGLMVFQKEKKIISTEEEFAAGYFGAQTRRMMVDTLVEKKVSLHELQSLEKTVVVPMKQNSILQNLVTQQKIEDLKPAVLKIQPKVQLKNSQPLLIVAMPHSQMVTESLQKQEVFVNNNGIKLPVVAPVHSLSLSRDTIRMLQKKLLSTGYLQTKATGILGKKTLGAIKTFQEKNNLVISGMLTNETVQVFEDLWEKHIAVWGFTKSLAIGSQGPDVRKLQKLLQEQGLYLGKTQGNFDSTLVKALIEYQKRNKIILKSTEKGAGVVGAKTLEYLNKDLFGL